MPLPVAGAELFRQLAAVAAANGLEITSCAETLDLTPYGIQLGSCIDAGYIARTFALTAPLGGKDPGQRAACGCIRSKDIGCYDSCPQGCIYCYAGRISTAIKNYQRHRPEAAALNGFDDKCE